MMNHLLLKGPKPKNSVTDPNKPLAILAGSDNFDDIQSGSSKSVSVKTWIESWNSNFPPKAKDKNAPPQLTDDSGKFPEQMIDIVRTEKERELDRYRKESSQRIKGGAVTPMFSSMFERSMAKSGKKI
jgi:hypothetical protein